MGVWQDGIELVFVFFVFLFYSVETNRYQAIPQTSDLRFAFTHQKIPALAADRDRTSPVHSPARVQAATCLSQLAHPSAGDQLF